MIFKDSLTSSSSFSETTMLTVLVEKDSPHCMLSQLAFATILIVRVPEEYPEQTVFIPPTAVVAGSQDC
jgi:hypothetical protein